jgi:hypothetical protein
MYVFLPHIAVTSFFYVAGSFGGTYFRPIYSSVTKKDYGDEVWKELPSSWLEGLNIDKQVASPVYRVGQNRYKV